MEHEFWRESARNGSLDLFALTVNHCHRGDGFEVFGDERSIADDYDDQVFGINHAPREGLALRGSGRIYDGKASLQVIERQAIEHIVRELRGDLFRRLEPDGASGSPEDHRRRMC